jgi:hypothetical protein
MERKLVPVGKKKKEAMSLSSVGENDHPADRLLCFTPLPPKKSISARIASAPD